MDDIRNIVMKLEREHTAKKMIEIMKTIFSSKMYPNEWKSARSNLTYKGGDMINLDS
jgi:hypothetical protein